jgi:hypothetical protein
LNIVRELGTWISVRLKVFGVPPEDLIEARLVIDIRTDEPPTDRTRIVSFRLASRCTLRTAQRVYESKTEERHHWHTRSPGARW